VRSSSPDSPSVGTSSRASVAIAAAVLARSQALLGFGLNSGVESLSATVVLWRLYAERRNPERAAAVEHRALASSV
jgi:hypothetical protein